MNLQTLQSLVIFSFVLTGSEGQLVPSVACQSQACIYVSNATNILAVPVTLQNQNPTSVISNLSRAVALDVHVKKRLIFWSDVVELSIKRASVNGGNVQVIVGNRIGVCDGLAVEWTTNLLYWTDTTYNKIEVAHLDGSRRKVLIATKLDEPRGIAVDPKAGFMFWTDWGSSPKIEKAHLTGESRHTIVSSSLYWPNDISLDFSQKRIYWVDAKLDKIEYSDYSGDGRNDLTKNHVSHPFGVEIYSSSLYWTEWYNFFGLYQVDKVTGSLISSLQVSPGSQTTIMGLAILDSSRQSSSSNLCQINNGGCEFLCLLKPNGVKCVCPYGKILESNGKSCKISGYGCKQPCLYLSNSTHIMAIDESLRFHPLLVLSNLSRAVALDVHVSRQLIFWTDVHEKSIMKASLNGSNVQVIIKDNIGVCDGLAVQWTNNLLYWTDTTRNTIEVAQLDGSKRKVLISTNLDQPRGIAVDPSSGLMFWTDWGATAKIEKAYLNGEGRQAIINWSLRWPNDIALDYTQKRIYWVDAYLDKIEYSDYSGAGRNTLFYNPIIHPFSVIILQTYLYWTDWNTVSGLHKMDKKSGSLYGKLHIPGVLNRMGLAVLDSSRQPSRSNNCQINNGGCEYLCLLKGNNYTCVCPYGKVLKADGKTCMIPDNGCQQTRVYISNATHIMAIDGSLKFQPLTVMSSLSLAVAVDIHVSHRLVFWSDVREKLIKRANLNGSSVEVIVKNNIGVCAGLAVLWTNDLFYWTDMTNNKIEVAHLNGSRRKVLISENLDKPRGIAVDPKSRLMFWTDWGSTAKIERAYLDGEFRQTIVASSLKGPNDITLDHDAQRIYWVDAGKERIESADYTGNRRTPHFSSTGLHPFGVALLGPWLYWTDWATSTGLHKLNRTSGNHTVNFHIPGKLMGLAVCDSSRQPTVSNGCQVNNGGCKFLCLLRPNGYVCACPNGTVLADDGQTCTIQGKNCLTFVPKPNTIAVSTCGRETGTQCSFKCRNGYSLTSGSTIVTCLLNGTWSGMGPSCSDSAPPVFNTCPANITIYASRDELTALANWPFPNATDNSGSPPMITSSHKPPLRLGEGVHHVSYTATDKAGNKATCSFTVTIKVIKCGMPKPSIPLQKVGCANHYGGKCNFTCPIGYRMVGEATLNCLSSNDTTLPGIWDRRLPFCKEIICKALPIPTNAVKSKCLGQANESVGAICLFSCNLGYLPSTPLTRTCLPNGTWSGKRLICAALSCPPLTKPKFGFVSPSKCLNGGKYKNICDFGCPSTFRLKGTTARICGSDGKWTGLNDTYCKDVAPPEILNICPSNKVYYIGACASDVTANWDRPAFKDNSGSVKVFEADLQPPVNLSEGLYDVNYTSVDPSGNIGRCRFKIQVARKLCRSLQPPSNGEIGSYSCNNYFGSVASISCNPGYLITGSKNRTCMFTGQWSGVQPTCTRMTCKQLPMFKFGSVEPKKSCVGVPVGYGTRCHFKCNLTRGFQNVGPTQLFCTINGTWSVDINEIYCKDVLPPVLNCPKDLTASTDTGKDFATVRWTLPHPQDNSREKLTLKVSGNIQPPHRFRVGATVVHYNTEDSAGHSTGCSFKITVIDNELPKVVDCPAKKEVKSNTRQTKVFFPKVIFTDNVGVTLITTNRVNGSKVLWGQHDVIYTAHDKAGNIAKCVMKLFVIAKSKCKRPSPPKHGGIACDNLPAGMFCTVHCNPGYVFATQLMPSVVYHCDASTGEWFKTEKSNPLFTDCSATTKPSAVVKAELRYLTQNCDQDHDEVKHKFFKTFEKLKHLINYCELDGCRPENIHVSCGERSKRSTTSDKILKINLQLNVPLPKNETSHLNQTVQNIQSSVFQSLDKFASSFEVRGVNLTLVTPPKVKYIGLECKTGFVLIGDSCAACPPGYFYDASRKSCSICPRNHFQEKEGQTSCLACPSGTSTVGYKGSKACTKAIKSSTPGNEVIVSVSVSAALLIIIVLALFFVIKRCRNPRRSSAAKAGSQRKPVIDFRPEAIGDDTIMYDIPPFSIHRPGDTRQTGIRNNSSHADRNANSNGSERSGPTYHNLGFRNPTHINNPSYYNPAELADRPICGHNHIYESIKEHRGARQLVEAKHIFKNKDKRKNVFKESRESSHYQMTNLAFEMDNDSTV